MNIRETFGIINPETNQRYDDILYSFLQTRKITKQDKKESKITIRPNFTFILHMDKVVRTKVEETGYCNCIVSFQVRKGIKIALAREFKKERESK